jgi:hypothetical protein
MWRRRGRPCELSGDKDRHWTSRATVPIRLAGWGDRNATLVHATFPVIVTTKKRSQPSIGLHFALTDHCTRSRSVSSGSMRPELSIPARWLLGMTAVSEMTDVTQPKPLDGASVLRSAGLSGHAVLSPAVSTHGHAPAMPAEKVCRPRTAATGGVVSAGQLAG